MARRAFTTLSFYPKNFSIAIHIIILPCDEWLWILFRFLLFFGAAILFFFQGDYWFRGTGGSFPYAHSAYNRRISLRDRNCLLLWTPILKMYYWNFFTLNGKQKENSLSCLKIWICIFLRVWWWGKIVKRESDVKINFIVKLKMITILLNLKFFE